MKLDCLLIHVPKFNNFYNPFGNHMFIMHMPMGLFAIADYLRQREYATQILHLGIEKIKDPNFSIKEYIKKTNPKVVGLTLHWHHQSYDCIKVAGEIKSVNPNIFVVLGGITASYFHEEIIREFNFIDGVIRGDGEEPFLRLTDEIFNQNNFTKVPNLTWRDKNGIKVNKITYIAQSEDLDRLNFTNFGLLKNYYLYTKYVKFPSFWIKNLGKIINPIVLGASQNILPLSVSRGCLWNCAFCGGSRTAQQIISGRDSIAIRSIEKVIESIKEAKGYNYDTIYLQSPILGKDFSYFENLFEEIKRRGIEINCIFDCCGLPSKKAIHTFKDMIHDLSKSRISLFAKLGSEDIRRLNKCYSYSNKELLDTLTYIDALKIVPEVSFELGRPFEMASDIEETKNLQQMLRKKIRCTSTETDILELVPASLMFLQPKKYDIIKNWSSFIDFFQAHSKINTFPWPNLGYSVQNFCGGQKNRGLDCTELFEKQLQKIRCKDFCRLANFISTKFIKTNNSFLNKVFSLFSRIFCYLIRFYWKLLSHFYRLLNKKL